MIRKIATVILTLAGLFSVLVGLMGLVSTEFTPYHAVVVGKDWSAIEPGVQSIILAMQRIEGSGFASTGVAILFLLIPIRRRELWACWAVPGVVAMNWIPTLYVAVWLRSVSPDAPTPVVPSAVFLGVVLIGVVLFVFERSKSAACCDAASS